MQNLIRYRNTDDAFDNLFRGIFMRPVGLKLRDESVADLQIKLDVQENEKTYTVHAEIPGVKKEDINISIDGNHVSISAEVKNEKTVNEENRVIRSERFYGKVSRAFALAQEVDDASAKATYNDGILELVLQKKVPVSAKRITVN